MTVNRAVFSGGRHVPGEREREATKYLNKINLKNITKQRFCLRTAFSIREREATKYLNKINLRNVTKQRFYLKQHFV